ncbi:endonuclease/exonuclease/phosphatase family protein [Streptomyces sp. Je 1-79]|uniref:endonuclease/exonuclease/phosphatase family protein n=1 Tax=Streptomyces sp. Je 1-79 TaxID=2943847 RepID=UPI0021A4AE08|nr:endonuclease/exonuclease/phosphatase family protein [Streptomyces sp. Je 1-79]MCT4357572.1 endonuclease/exonuclease/phosphatase family protein [Streptomyces sp. Je 1-79]
MEGTRRRRGLFTAVAVAVGGGLLLAHPWVPGLPGHVMSLVETFLPWLGLAVPVGLIVAAVRRSVVAALVCVVVGAVWLGVFREALGSPETSRAYDLTVVQHNVSDENTSPSRVARILLGPDPDVVALQELTPTSLPAFRVVLAPTHPHHATVGTVGLWSKYPLTDVERVDLKPAEVAPGWERGMRAVVRSPHGPVTTYVAHLPSVRIRATQGYATAWRDESAVRLGRALAADRSAAVLVLGDLNGTVDDRGLDPVLSQVRGDRSAFAFSWPASLPLARIDHVLARGDAEVGGTWTLPGTGSDHLPVAARVRR